MKFIKRFPLNQVIWYSLLIFLPFTSLPLAAKLLRSSMVSAPSIIFMALLFIILITQALVKRKQLFLPKPLLIFFLAALFSCSTAYFIDIPIIRDFSIINNEIEGIITLTIGVSFIIVFINFLSDRNILIQSIRAIAFSMIPVVIWSAIQFGSWMLFNEYPEIVSSIQGFVSTSGNLYKGRITGFAYEPSWFAHLLNMVYLPLWMGLSITNTTVFKRQLFKINIENYLLLISIALLILTKSRVGYVTFAFMALFYFVKLQGGIVRLVGQIFNKKFKQNINNKLISLFLIFAYILSFAGGIFLVSKFDSRMENLLNPDFYNNQNISSIANEFQFAERIMYWQSGWRVFNDYPILGVGLGNSGFFFKEKLPEFAWALDEPRDIFYYENYLPNNKNLWTKLLSETGIIGFGFFVIWLITILSKSILLTTKKDRLLQSLGYIGIFACIAFVFEGFSIDSFALPYFWIIPGIVSAIYLHQDSSQCKSQSKTKEAG